MKTRRFFAFLLALCLMSALSFGASAFKDDKDIQNTEAVDMCVALKILSGFDDDTFRPAMNITRAEFAKMVCVVLNGGKLPTTSTNPTPTFSDIRGTIAEWAEGFIEDCYAKGVVSGVGDGKFNPQGSITGTEAAKMLLVALGYDATVENFNGSNWDLLVNVRANQDGCMTIYLRVLNRVTP